MKAIIFNSGLGKRMGSLTENCHKSMVKVNDETIFERQLRILSDSGIKDFIITTGPFKEQLENVCKNYDNLNFIFVENEIYDKTNYIYSMFLANKYLDDDVLLLHGDLVFNKNLITDILNNENKSLGLINEEKQLPEKDFKARVKDGNIQEVGINIFDSDCYAFQPLYKLSKKDLNSWKMKVEEFIKNGNDKVYAENALNEILPKLEVKAFSYKTNYIDEVDTPEDLQRVSKEILNFDYNQQEVYNSYKSIEKVLKKKEIKRPLIVCDKFIVNSFIYNYIKTVNNNCVVFTDFKPNPIYEDVVKGVKLLKNEKCDFIISIGGGSAIDTAKAIKLFSNLDEKTNYLKQEFKYSNIQHLSIPTTAGTGSESTRYSVVYYNSEKQSLTHNSIIPDYVILESKLLKTLPEYQKKATMLDALCQAIESYWSVNSNDISKNYSKKAIKLILKNRDNYLLNKKEALQEMILASNYAGKAINITQTTAPHAMSYKITSLYNIPHGQAVGMCLPYIFEYMINNTDKCIDKRGKEYLKNIFNEINEMFNSSDIIKTLKEIYSSMEFEEKEVKNQDLEILVKSVNTDRLKNNPVLLDEKTIEDLYIKILNIK